ncbi:putative brct domain-containing protein [Phaeoacremonium minimum UCRPA7]|uniref:Putative brct domain-containing protein n=1 Tax=Phaeoacremonium minimum (strain UCR-PA7) TaxID=1286976 RepID=R8BIK1_PHAM7|nr:putative brct domain-containing protein [Phaeoacremonium minimum UCRPA7]EON99155.1 putative brct domain-containing protein [Phaeoacremonium minimum UCRPA7]
MELSSDHGDPPIDASKPFQGVVVCCTSIAPEQRTHIAKITVELGGIHKHDLTPDITHLIVGEYDTAKYRHVAKERPDIKPMAAGWVEAMKDLWINDQPIDFTALENEWSLKVFETCGEEINAQGQLGDRGRLLCCLTGFDDPDERQSIIEKITSNGGNYTGDLTRKVTHLIVFKAEGRKYAAAKNWNVHTVSIEWLDDSIKRGMILDEKCYDPLMPKEERGKGAWTKKEVRRVSLGKRLRDGAAAQDEGKRKLRKTASMKLSSQRENLWGDILGKPPSMDPSATGPDEEPTQVAPSRSFGGQSANSTIRADLAVNNDGLVFLSSLFYPHGFSRAQTDILIGAITSLGGTIATSLSAISPKSSSKPFSHHLLVVPQTSKPESHPTIPEGVDIITEFFIEKCMHKKQFFEPRDHVIGRPFPVSPLPSFDKLSICTAGFTGPDLNQVSKTINQLGASYEERFTQQSSVLVCSSLKSVRKQKLDLALVWRIPVVSADWLWECISTGHKVPFNKFMFPELRQKITPEREDVPPEKRKPALSNQFESGAKPHKQHIREVDMSAFEKDSIGPVKPQAPEISKEESTTTAHFETAPTHQSNESTGSGRGSVPLSEKSASALNKSPSPRKQGKQPIPRKSLARVRSEVCDSETQDDEDYTPNQYDGPVMADAEEQPDDIGTKLLEKEKIAAAERIALSSRLTTLLEATGSGGATISFESVSTREEDFGPSGVRPGGRRKRGIMGRAISNVSVASTGSVDSSSGAAGGKSASAVASFPVSVAADGQDESTQRGPSSTQIEYEDPEAKKSKALLMNKMLGTTDVSTSAIVDPDKGKITLKDIQGFPREAEVMPGRSGRSMRRR